MVDVVIFYKTPPYLLLQLFVLYLGFGFLNFVTYLELTLLMPIPESVTTLL